MDDLISRQAAIDALLHNQEVYSNNFGTDAIDKYTIAIIDNDVQTIAQLQPAQPERKKAKWVHGKEIAREYLAGRITYIEYKDYHCSECGYTVEDIRWNVDGELVDRYCTACGAQMEVEK